MWPQEAAHEPVSGRNPGRVALRLERFRSKAQCMVDVSIALFARFAGNDRIGDLIPMLA